LATTGENVDSNHHCQTQEIRRLDLDHWHCYGLTRGLIIADQTIWSIDSKPAMRASIKERPNLSHTTWRTCLGVALLLAMSGTVGNSRADIISAMATGNGSSVTSSSYGVGVTFSDYAGGPYPASVVYESIGGANALTLTYNSPGD
jgi:hypothetical protein